MFPNTLDTRMYLLCFGIVHFTVEQTFEFIQSKYPEHAEELEQVKRRVIELMYLQNQEVDKNDIRDLIDKQILLCVNQFEERFGVFENLQKYFLLYDIIMF